MNTSHNKQGRRKTAGYSLIEVLVSVIIVAVGMLGLAATSMASLRKTNQSNYRAIASALSIDASERFRGMKSNNVVITAAGSSCATTTGCTSNPVMAANDYYSWQQMVKRQLPVGNGVICRDSTPTTPDVAFDSAGNITNDGCDGTGKIYAIKVTWADPSSTQRQVFTLIF